MKTITSSKSKAIIDAHGGLPRFFIRILCDLEDFITQRKKDKAAFKKLSPSQGRALNRMGLTLKKDTKTYAKLMAEYRANPTTSDDEGSDADMSDDDDEKPEAKVVSDDDDSDSDSDSDSSSSSSSSSDSGSDSDSDSSSVSTRA